MNSLITNNSKRYKDIFMLILIMTAAYFVVWSFVGFGNNPYNSYVLQAVAWCNGHLDLGQNYSHLEIAEFNGKYYISFPPFPSVVYFPFAIFMGEKVPEELIMLITAYLGGIYAYKIARHFNINGRYSIFWALFVTIGSNLLLLSVNAWVWFIAQSMSFTLAMISIYYALKGRGGLSLAFWACCVGCRPFQIVMLPLLALILFSGNKAKKFTKWFDFKWLIAPIVIAVFYMTLNYLRFGSITEFGHKYLPEFVNLETGMFNPEYLIQNLKNMFRFPALNSDGTLEYPKFNGMNIFMASPIFFAGLIYTILFFINGSPSKNKPVHIILPILIILELLMIAMKNNLGGLQFGCRYTVDVLPMTFLYIMLTRPASKNSEYYLSPLFIFGLCLNIAGTIMLYTDNL